MAEIDSQACMYLYTSFCKPICSVSNLTPSWQRAAMLTQCCAGSPQASMPCGCCSLRCGSCLCRIISQSTAISQTSTAYLCCPCHTSPAPVCIQLIRHALTCALQCWTLCSRTPVHNNKLCYDTAKGNHQLKPVRVQQPAASPSIAE